MVPSQQDKQSDQLDLASVSVVRRCTTNRLELLIQQDGISELATTAHNEMLFC